MLFVLFTALLNVVIIDEKSGNKLTIKALTGAKNKLAIALIILKNTLKIALATNHHPRV